MHLNISMILVNASCPIVYLLTDIFSRRILFMFNRCVRSLLTVRICESCLLCFEFIAVIATKKLVKTRLENSHSRSHRPL